MWTDPEFRLAADRIDKPMDNRWNDWPQLANTNSPSDHNQTVKNGGNRQCLRRNSRKFLY